MKKLMILGGSRYAVPVIQKAHELGVYVITADYLPDNIAHKYSDEYRNISIIEKEAVLDAAKELRIDGILSFACDPGVVTAAFVAEQLQLNFQGSYQAVSVLQDKGLFRQFLAENGFHCPHARRYTDSSAPMNEIDFFQYPVIVKPVDSAGSKGVTKADSPECLPDAIKTALQYSHNGAFIIEDFLTFDGFHSSADVFTVNGKIRFITYSDQLFDKEAENPYTPAMIIYPSTMPKSNQDYLSSEIQRLMTLLNMKTGIYNIETCVGTDGKPYIMEVSPRGGGCKIAEIQKMAFGIDLIEAEIRNALNLPLNPVFQTTCGGFWCETVIHARSGESGIFQKLSIDPAIEKQNVKLIDMSVTKGDMVYPFTGANRSLGDMFLKFECRETLDAVMSHAKDWLKIELKG